MEVVFTLTGYERYERGSVLVTPVILATCSKWEAHFQRRAMVAGYGHRPD